MSKLDGLTEEEIAHLREFDRRFGRLTFLLGSRGFAVAAGAVAMAELVLARTSQPSGLRNAARMVVAAGVPLAACFGLFFAAGTLAVLMPSWRVRRIVGVTLAVAAAVAFLFVPICWSPKSDDCRSMAVRVRDGVTASWRS